MKRSPPPSPFLRFPAVAMSSRSSCRGGGNQWRRSYSDSPHNVLGGAPQFVNGDSHFRSVQEANLGFHRGGGGGGRANSVSNSQQPLPYYQPQQYRPPSRYNHNRPSQPPPPRQNQQFRLAPPFGTYRNQSFRPHQHFRPQRPKPLDYRHWEYSKTAPLPNSQKVIILSYNILADCHAIDHWSKLYRHIPPNLMGWERRKRSILFELGLWSADIMCLQEVDRFQELEEELKLMGYSGIWKMRTGNAKDGCAVFWRTSRMKLLYEEAIEFNELGLRDNVTQICVLELMGQNNASNTSALPASLLGSNKVVICNIHVLYNPKRGEIKLGQVRVLLDRANTVSKIWNDIPVVLCGDFNCTPKSPLYNFISEQKLDLSGIDRDKVSGQASAEICFPRKFNPGHNPDPNASTQSSDSLSRAIINIKQGDSLSDMQKPDNLDKAVENIPSTDDHYQPDYARTVLDVSDMSCTVVLNSSVDGVLRVEETEQTEENMLHDRKGGIGPAISVLIDTSKDSSTAFNGDGELPVEHVSDEIDRSTPPLASPPEDACSDRNEMGEREKGNSASPPYQGLLFEHSQPNICKVNTSSNFDSLENSLSDSCPGTSGCPSSPPIVNDEDTGLSTPNQTNTSTSSRSIYHVEDSKLEDVSSQELNDFFLENRTTVKDESTFLSAVHDTKDSLPHNFDYAKEFAADPNDSQLHSPGNATVDDFSLSLDSEVFVEKTVYDPSLWTPMEIATATGSADCTFLEHPLKLKSTYTEVKDCSGSRDMNGEPLVTSYNNGFLGTVDYIWCSEGLQTVRVLAPIPRHVMQGTKGFPTKKWGSDHIALVSELAFTKDATGIA